MAPEDNDTSRGGYGLERGEWESRRRPDGSQRPATAAEQARDLRRQFGREATGIRHPPSETPPTAPNRADPKRSAPASPESEY